MAKTTDPIQFKETYIHPLTDFGFKKLFGTEANKDLLIDFLNQLLPAHHFIHDLSYDKNEQLGADENTRKAFYDIHCTSKAGEKFIVELQRAKQTFYKDRCLYYSTFPIRSQAPQGVWNFELKAVYTISIMDFMFKTSKEHPRFVHHVQLKDEDGAVFYDKLRYIYIELPKFTKTLEQLETHFEKWLFVFRWIYQLNQRPKKLQERIFSKFFKLAKIANLTPMERAQYHQSRKQYWDAINTLKYAEDKGREEGMEKGMEKGMEIEREKKNLQAIKIGLENNLPLNLIAKLTDLSVDEVKKIIEEQGWKI